VVAEAEVAEEEEEEEERAEARAPELLLSSLTRPQLASLEASRASCVLRHTQNL
jgi:hypothetical protein